MWLVGLEPFFVMSKYLQSNEWCWEKRSPLYKITVSVEINIYLTAELTSKKSWTVSVYCNLKNISRNGGINWRQKNKRVQSRYYLLFPSWQGNLAPKLVYSSNVLEKILCQVLKLKKHLHRWWLCEVFESKFNFWG